MNSVYTYIINLGDYVHVSKTRKFSHIKVLNSYVINISVQLIISSTLLYGFDIFNNKKSVTMLSPRKKHITFSIEIAYDVKVF